MPSPLPRVCVTILLTGVFYDPLWHPLPSLRKSGKQSAGTCTGSVCCYETSAAYGGPGKVTPSLSVSSLLLPSSLDTPVTGKGCQPSGPSTRRPSQDRSLPAHLSQTLYVPPSDFPPPSCMCPPGIFLSDV